MVSKDSMDLYYVAYVAQCFSKLMRKRFLISSEDLQLDWRPLFRTYERLSFSEKESLGLRFVPDNLDANLSQAIRLTRPHFPLNATQEMLEEWRPMLCPFSTSIHRAITYFNLFLPTTLPPEHHDVGFKLWFDEIISLWLSGKFCSGIYGSKLTLLLSRLSSDCMGYVDWDPYLPQIFNQFKSSLNLNVGTKFQSHRRIGDFIDVGPCVQWMVYMINKNNICLDYISKLFKAIESFYHPSNTDKRWHGKLQQFLYKLPACYVKRLYRERFKKNIWSKRIPENFKLTDELTSKFVDSLMPIVLTSMFNQAGISSAALAFRDLSVLRPEKVIPPLLDRLYGSYETLTEPHRLQASINCMASVLPAMLRPCKYFPDGPSHVVPLLLNSLPGIDSNDMRKTIAVLRFVATLASQIRMKDHSNLVEERPELTYQEQQMCLATSQFEDFVIQFLDKCFILIENTTTASLSNLDQESHLKNGEEGIIEAAISSVTLSILAQASNQIQTAVLDKIYSHVTRHLFDIKTRGKAIAFMSLACAKSLPKETLSKFIPHFSRLILTLTDYEEIYEESSLDEELLFSLLLISEIVRCSTSHIVEYKDLIINVMKRALRLTAKDGYLLGCSILRHLLRALTNLACCDWRNIDLDDEVNRKREEEWPFNNWGHTSRIDELKLKWEIPGPQSRKFAEDLLEIFLKGAVCDLLDWTQGKKQMTKKEIQRSLHIILSSLVGAGSVLPPLKSTVINLCPYEVPIETMCISKTGTEPLNFPDGSNIRTWVVENMKSILEHIMKFNEDDTKSLGLVCEIFGNAISYFGYNKSEIRLASQRIKTLKMSTQNKLLGSKRHLRYLLVERVAQQHRAMLLNKGHPYFTELHLDIFKALFKLSLSHYVEVRITAQDTVYLMINYFPFSEAMLVPMLVDELKQPEIEHTRFKGLLNLLLGRRSYNPIVIDPNWSYLKEIWPALVSSPYSDRPSIVKLLDRICGLVQKGFDTFELRTSFKDTVKEHAKSIWKSDCIDKNKYKQPDDELTKQVLSKVETRNNRRVQDYNDLTLKLTELIDDPRMHWHRRVVAYNLFSHLMREDHPIPLSALESCLNNLINDRLSIRSKAIQLVTAQLKLHKRKHVKRKITFAKERNLIDELGDETSRLSLSEKGNVNREKTTKSDVISGQPQLQQQQIVDNYNILSNSNKWMQYTLDDRYYTKEEWDKLIFIDKSHIGFYDWPQYHEVYEPYEKQPKLNRQIEELNEFERCVYDKFHDEQFIEKLVMYLCFEDKGKGVPNLFKGIFRNFGPCMLEPLKKHVLEHSTSKCEHKQKFVIEFIAGSMRGSKHWSYEMMNELRDFVMPIIESMSITQENFDDWTGMSNYVSRNRDKRRFQWWTNHFIKKAISDEETTSPTVTPFIQSRRLILANYNLIQCEWRALDYIFPIVVESLKKHLLSYSNVRSCLASIYSLIFMFDDPSIRSNIPDSLAFGPKRNEFIEFLLPKLAILENSKRSSVGQIVCVPSLTDSSIEVEKGLASSFNADVDDPVAVKSNCNSDPDPNPISVSKSIINFNPEAILQINGSNNGMKNESQSKQVNAEDSPERKDAIKLMKFTASWLIYNVFRVKSALPADFLRLLPLFCEMSRDANDIELATESSAALAVLGSSELSSEATEQLLLCLRKIVSKNSWHARAAAAALIEIVVSSNFFKLISNEAWRKEIQDIVINDLICDDRIEVRESSLATLSGMIHCDFIKMTPGLLKEFKRRANEPIIKRKQPNGTTMVVDSKKRHSGIICLCSCVDAHPYTVPDYLPEILTLLSDHLSDPQPISVSNNKYQHILY